MYLKPVFQKLFKSKIGDVCINLGYITQEQLSDALEEQKRTGKKLGEILVSKGYMEEKDLSAALCGQEMPEMDDKESLEYLKNLGIPKEKVISELEDYFGVKYVDLVKAKPSVESLNIERLMLQGVLPFYQDDKEAYFAVSNLGDSELKDNIKLQCKKNGLTAKLFFAFKHEIDAKYKQMMSKEVDVEDSEDGAKEWVDKIIIKGIKLGASDIHIEPISKQLQVRFRIDGILSKKEMYPFSWEFIQSIISRIKISAGMDIAESRKAQDGRIDKFQHNNDVFDMRISSLLTTHGEKIVMRIFNKNSGKLSFKSLGFLDDDQRKLNNMLKKPHGILYLAGATGSGKTTTMYSMIDKVNSDEINICSVEDPVEKDMPGVNQVQINNNSGVTYPATLKAFLRQDPDVIVVGEIRDEETARLSLQAALTGHLVISTIHTNGALDTINRLRSMQIEPYAVSATALGFVSQRLVRVLCDCKAEKEPNAYEQAWVDYITNKYDVEPSKFYAAVGCVKCNGIGYKGRTVVAEIAEVDPLLKGLIAKDKETCAIEKKLLEQGYTPLDLDAFYKVSEGITSIEEVLRVI